MAKLDLNTFYKQHQSRVCFVLEFPDWADAKKHFRKRGSSIVLLKDGRELPSPNKVASKLIRSKTKGDYYLASHASGAVQQIMITDPADVQSLSSFFSVKGLQQGNGQPCTERANIGIDTERHIKLAQVLGML